MLIALIIGFAIVAIIFFFWVMRSMLDALCPTCLEDGDQEMVIPLLPGIRWFCPSCGGAFRNSEVRAASKKAQESSASEDDDDEYEDEE